MLFATATERLSQMIFWEWIFQVAKSDVLGAEPYIDSYTEPYEKPTEEEHEAYIKANFDPMTRSMLEDFPSLTYKKQLKVLVFMEDVKLEP